MTVQNILSLFIIIILSLTSIFVSAQEKKFSIEVGPEYRSEDFRWSIAGNMQGQNPNILSELIFKPIRAKGIYVNGEFRPIKQLSVSIDYNKLWTFDGEVTDFDYDGDNRTDPATELYLQSREGIMRNVGAKLNYHFFDNDFFSAAAGTGYNFNKELFYLTNDDDPALRSTYQADWNGPNLILKGLAKLDRFNIGAGITGHYLFYYAKANWNLVETFRHPVSFTHNAQGNGFDYRLTLGFSPTNFLNIGLHGLYSNWRTYYGKDRLFSANGEIFDARLNGVFKKNAGLRLTTTFMF